MAPTTATTTAAWLRRWAMHAVWRGGHNALPNLLFSEQYLPWRADPVGHLAVRAWFFIWETIATGTRELADLLLTWNHAKGTQGGHWQRPVNALSCAAFGVASNSGLFPTKAEAMVFCGGQCSSRSRSGGPGCCVGWPSAQSPLLANGGRMLAWRESPLNGLRSPACCRNFTFHRQLRRR